MSDKLPELEAMVPDVGPDELKKGMLDPLWRIRNLYWIRTEDGQVRRFVPNEAQERILDAIYVKGHTKLIIPKARQRGMSTLIAIISLDLVLFYSTVQASLVDFNGANAKKKLDEKVVLAFNHLPQSVRRNFDYNLNRQEGTFTIWRRDNPESKSWFLAGDKPRGGTNQLLWISEWAEIAAKFPSVSLEIKLGALKSAGTPGALIIIETTWHGGKTGDVWPLVEMALTTQEEDKTLSDWRVMFVPWWESAVFRNRGNPAQITDETRKYFAEKSAKLGVQFDEPQMLWWQIEKRISGIYMSGQYPTDIEECFASPVEGAIYADLIAEARTQGRISDFIIDYSIPIDTLWDLGNLMNTVVWYCQSIAGRRRFVDVDIGLKLDLSDRKKHMDGKGYVFGKHILPHDGNAQWTTGATFQTEMMKAGFENVVVLKPIKSVSLRIQKMREILPSCSFHKTKCKDGIKGLEHYRYRAHPKEEGHFLDEPVHDSSSHIADSAGYLGEGLLSNIISTTGDHYTTNAFFDTDAINNLAA